MGKLIVIEGTDGSGKATQTTRLFERLQNLRVKVMRVSFPQYESDSSGPIKMYLRGDLGSNPMEINPYACSMFYAVDRFASFQTWKNFFAEDNTIVLADRYTGSNAAHQGAKFNRKADREKFFNWLEDVEFKKFQMPHPNLTIFLNMPPEISAMLRRKRGRVDLHEDDNEYMLKAYKAYCEVAQKFGWKTIDCAEGNFAKSAIDIEDEVFRMVEELLIS